jgi:predicted ATPase/class 3 adenylate cyclase
VGLPTGTVTFAFTDIEGSTQRWERDAAAMQDALRRHDAVIRAAIVAGGGHVFKTLGDAFCAAFWQPEEAIEAMVAAQNALATEDFSAIDGLRVRIAVHTGSADERDNDYFGATVNRVARLLAIGHGGQILVSGTTSRLVEGALPAQTSLRDLGEHRLKDLTRPEHVFQLVAPALESEFPPLRSLDARRNNLPIQSTSFVGRTTELAEITALVKGYRLVTLVGSGGIGKTRTSLQVGANLLDERSDGVWFVELAPLSSGDYIPTTVAQALGLTLSPEGDPSANLTRALEAKKMLLVFDNCEHLVQPAARLISTIVRTCPNVTVLASSRQALGVEGEVTYRLPTLDVPSAVDAARFTAEDAARCAATALFIERARAVDQRFVPTDENASTIAEICRRLDGIPLAIELAAARVKILTPRQLRERLDERFRVLTRGNRDVLPRQQTLRALIDWSHDLLDERERTLFRRLGVFVDGFTLEAAASVGSGAGLDAIDVFELLDSLVDKSLVLAEADGDAMRFRMLESTRAYAAEKLESAGERAATARRHLLWLRDRFAEAWLYRERTGAGDEIDALFAAALDDVRAALDWASADDPRAGGELIAALDATWRYFGIDGEGIARLEAYAANLADDDPALLSRLWIAFASLAGDSGHVARALDAAAGAVALARASGDGLVLGHALRTYALCAAKARRFDEAQAALGEARALGTESVRLPLLILDTMAFVSGLCGDLDASARAYEQLREANRALGSVRDERANVINLAETEHERGNSRRAIALLHELLPDMRSAADRVALTNVLTNLAAYHVAVDELAAASDAAREVIRALAPRDPRAFQVAVAAEHLALALALADDLERACRLAAYAETALGALGFEREYAERATRERLVALLAARLEPAERERLEAQGASLAPTAAIALALGEP